MYKLKLIESKTVDQFKINSSGTNRLVWDFLFVCFERSIFLCVLRDLFLNFLIFYLFCCFRVRN